MRVMNGSVLTISSIVLLISSFSMNDSPLTDHEMAATFRDVIGGAFTTAWTGSDCFIWPGIVCDLDTLRVTDIVLRASDSMSLLVGNEKLDWFDDWTGLISYSLCLLDQLTTLIVTDWSSIFDEISACITSPSLRILNLSGNRISGDISADIEKLSQLIMLNLADNEISGSILPSIVNLRNLKLLDVSNNKISGEIPLKIRKLKMLSRVILSGNQLSGSIPTLIATLSRMADLDPSVNRISGSIPKRIGSMPILSVLNLYFNQLSGEIPTSLLSNKGLSHLNLS